MLILMACLCGRTQEFELCCAPYLKKEKSPQSAEDLMRARFCAFCVKDIDYVMNTTDPMTRRLFDRRANEEWAANAQFLKLEILKAEEKPQAATVEFKAFFKILGSEEVRVHHEISRFKRHFGQWYFSDGKVLN